MCVIQTQFPVIAFDHCVQNKRKNPETLTGCSVVAAWRRVYLLLRPGSLLAGSEAVGALLTLKTRIHLVFFHTSNCLLMEIRPELPNVSCLLAEIRPMLPKTSKNRAAPAPKRLPYPNFCDQTLNLTVYTTVQLYRSGSLPWPYPTPNLAGPSEAK
jgi:hypothetical protein